MVGASWGGSEELWSQAAVRLAQAGHTVAALVEQRPPLAEKMAALPHHGVPLRLRDPWRGSLAKAMLARLTGWRPPDADNDWLLRQKPDLVVISQGSNTDGSSWMMFCRGHGLAYAAIVQCNAETAWPAVPDGGPNGGRFPRGPRGVLRFPA